MNMDVIMYSCDLKSFQPREEKSFLPRLLDNFGYLLGMLWKFKQRPTFQMVMSHSNVQSTDLALADGLLITLGHVKAVANYYTSLGHNIMTQPGQLFREDSIGSPGDSLH